MRATHRLLALSALFFLTGAKGTRCQGGDEPGPASGSGGGSETASSGGGSAGGSETASSGGGSAGGSETASSGAGSEGGGGSAGSGGSGGAATGGCEDPPPVVGTPAPLGCALFTDLGALLEVCGGHDDWSRQAEAFCNAQYPVGGYAEGIIPGPFCDDPSQGVRLDALECCPNRECCWNGAGFAHTYPAYCPGEAVDWQLCEGQPGVCCDTAGGPTFQPVCGCEPGSVLPQESCSVCCRRGIQLALSRPAACDPAQVVPSSWCAPDSPDLVHLRRCGLASPCESSFEIGGGDAPWNLCILEFLASGAAGYVEAEDSGDYSRGEYIYVQAPGAALWQRFYESDGDHPPTIPAPPVECVLRPSSYFESCLISGDPACSRPENWFVSCSDAPITTCP